MIKTIDGIIEAARGGEPGIIAVAAAHDRPVIQAVAEARREGIAVPVLVGHADEIAAMLRELGEDPAAYAAEVSQVTDGIRAELARELEAGLEIRPSKKVGAGFRLAAKDGSGYFDCSQEEIARMLDPFFRDTRL